MTTTKAMWCRQCYMMTEHVEIHREIVFTRKIDGDTMTWREALWMCLGCVDKIAAENGSLMR